MQFSYQESVDCLRYHTYGRSLVSVLNAIFEVCRETGYCSFGDGLYVGYKDFFKKIKLTSESIVQYQQE